MAKVNCKICGEKTVKNRTGLCSECTKNIMREMGRKGGMTTWARYGTEYYKQIGYKGGKAKRNVTA